MGYRSNSIAVSRSMGDRSTIAAIRNRRELREIAAESLLNLWN